MSGLDHPTRGVRVPTADASGECWHAVGGCGGHNVTRIQATGVELVAERGLRPCQAAACQAAGIPTPERCDGCGTPVFGPDPINAASYCPECATYLHKHPSATDHELYALREPAGETA